MSDECAIRNTIRVVPGRPPELVVHDNPSTCPYLPDRPARMPLRLPARSLRADELDLRLAAGDRRQGVVLYRTECPDCTACVPLRIEVERFLPSRTHRRILRRGDRMLSTEVGPPTLDDRRVALYNRHKLLRGLGDENGFIDRDGYLAFLVETCCDSFEMRFFRGTELAGVAIVDRGNTSLSAMYCYYDPELKNLSIGTYAILKQIEICRQRGMRYLYLGLYVEGSPTMAYKARFYPHEQRRGGRWTRVSKSES
jgi:arginyl-tRNA--protein-N-Asp/Glu arginylyltransferase